MGSVLVQPEIQAQYLFIEWLVIYEVKYIKFNVNLAANWDCLCVVVRENFLLSYCMSAALDMHVSQQIV